MDCNRVLWPVTKYNNMSLPVLFVDLLIKYMVCFVAKYLRPFVCVLIMWKFWIDGAQTFISETNKYQFWISFEAQIISSFTAVDMSLLTNVDVSPLLFLFRFALLFEVLMQTSLLPCLCRSCLHDRHPVKCLFMRYERDSTTLLLTFCMALFWSKHIRRRYILSSLLVTTCLSIHTHCQYDQQ